MNEISLARKKMKPFLASVLFSTFREMTRGNVFSEGAQKGFWYYSLWTKQLWGESISKVLNFLEKNPTSYLFFYLLISWTSQSEIRRKLTSFVIWPQLPIFQLKSLLRRGRKTCPKKWNEMAILEGKTDVVKHTQYSKSAQNVQIFNF